MILNTSLTSAFGGQGPGRAKAEKKQKKGNFLGSFFVELKKEDIFAIAFEVTAIGGRDSQKTIGPVVQFG